MNSTTRRYHVYTVVSRRGAGVWTNLPSLTFSMLARGPSSERALWIDLGMRYEMFNHFRISARRFPFDASLVGVLMNEHLSAQRRAVPLLTYQQVIAPQRVSDVIAEPPLSEITGNCVPEYREAIKNYPQSGRVIFLLPLQTFHNEPASAVAYTDPCKLSSALAFLISQLTPTYVFLTCEGQPELALFRSKLKIDPVLRWALSVADSVLSFVRFDSKERFCDSAGMATALTSDVTIRDKLRVILTRAATAPRRNVQAFEFVSGVLPFANFVGTAVNNGRIPIVDVWIKQASGEESDDQRHFRHACDAAADALSRNDGHRSATADGGAMA